MLSNATLAFRSAGSTLIINGHCCGESVFQIDKFINDLQFLSIHSDGWFAVRLPGAGWCITSVYFVPIGRSKLSFAFDMSSKSLCIFSSPEPKAHGELIVY